MDQCKGSSIFGSKNTIIVAFILIIFIRLIDGAPQSHNEQNDKFDYLKACMERLGNTAIVSFTSSKEDLNKECLKVDETVSCINKYKDDYLTQSERNWLKDTKTVLNELCKPGSYQEEFLRHAPCIQKATNVYESCNKGFQQKFEKDNIEKNPNASVLERLCCAVQDYKKCTNNAMRQLCGEKTAQFVDSFAERMTSKKFKSDCGVFNDKCDQLNATMTTSILHRRK